MEETKDATLLPGSDVEAAVVELTVQERVGMLTPQKQDWYWAICHIYDDDVCFEIIDFYTAKRGGIKFGDVAAEYESLNECDGEDYMLNKAITEAVILNTPLYAYDITRSIKTILMDLNLPVLGKNANTEAFKLFGKLFLYKTITQTMGSGNTLDLYTPIVAKLVIREK